LYEEISSGGMASVHFGRLSSDAGFSRTVAIKYLHPHYARDTQFISMFLDEARLVSRIRHPNVATPLDVVVVPETQEVFLVMEYIHGETLARLIRSALRLRLPLPPSIAAAILAGALTGLHAAHEAVDETGVPLNIVHRDISPQNIMVGDDGVPRVLDFGIAKAVSRSQSTQEGEIKGKISYMSPEQLTERAVDRRADIFAAGIVLWEALAMRRLFANDDIAGAIAKVLHCTIPRPSSINGYVSQALDRVVLRALSRNPAARFQTAREFAAAIEEDVLVASTRKVSEWVAKAAAKSLDQRAQVVARIESEPTPPPETPAPAAQSLRTVSQTVAILREHELRGDYDEENDQRTPALGASKAERAEAATKVLAAPPPEPVTLPPPADREVSPAAMVVSKPAEIRATVTALVGSWMRRKQALVGGAILTVVSVLAAAGLAARSPGRPAASPRELSSAVPPGPRVLPIAEATASDIAAAELAKVPEVIATVREPTARIRHAPKARTKKLAKDCDPPFFIDGNGIRRIKARCL
jgi:eukaryotic-like serine/threonine-protein kinase